MSYKIQLFKGGYDVWFPLMKTDFIPAEWNNSLVYRLRTMWAIYKQFREAAPELLKAERIDTAYDKRLRVYDPPIATGEIDKATGLPLEQY